MLCLLLLVASVSSESTVDLDLPCNSTSFGHHTCHVNMTNLTSPTITSADDCVAACCAATKFVCTYAGWEKNQCTGGNVKNQNNKPCLRSGATTFLVNYSPPPPPPIPPPPPSTFRFANAVASNMVLASAPKQAMVWGFCPAGSVVEVSLDGGAKIQATIGPDQATGASTTWRAKLPATTASFMNHTITAISAGTTLTLTDVMFGEVWVCSGQSNMEYPIGSPTCWNQSNFNCTSGDAQCNFGCTQNAGEEIAAMPHYDNGMRLMMVDGGSSTYPKPDMHSTGWLTPSAMGGKFSAACWYYGRDVYNAMSPKVPVGLIATDVGGTPDQHWSSPDAIKQCTGPNPWQWAAGFKDSVLWNAMVVPILRTVHSGVIWYQGENNAINPRRYNCSFPAMIEDWRAKWHAATDGATDQTFPYGWAQINSYGKEDKYADPLFVPTPTANQKCGGGCEPQCNSSCMGELHEWGDIPQGNPLNIDNGFPGIRYAQSLALGLANTFMAVIIDTPVASGSIHSPFKQPCGRRLARGGLAVAYGMKAMNAVNPVAESVAIVDGAVVITVGGLGTTGVLTATVGAVGFEVLGGCSVPDPKSKGNNITADCWRLAPIASVAGAAVTLDKTALPTQPRAVRYLWYISPYITQPASIPVYVKGAAPLPGAVPLPTEFVNEQLPLGPFIMPLKN